MKKIRLFVSVYKSEDCRATEVLYPVSAGAALYGAKDAKLALCDDSGTHISDWNPQYCELTVQYWAWQNQTFDIGGLLHQRRYFDVSSPHPYAIDQPKKPKRPYRIVKAPTDTVLQQSGITGERITSLMERYRWIAPLSENIYQSVEEYYNRNDRRKFDDLRLLRSVIQDLYPAYSDSAEAYFRQSEAYFCNMFIADHALFAAYSEWLFAILAEYTRRKPPQAVYPREQGKLAERLFGVYTTYLKTHTDIAWAELPRIHFTAIDGTTPHNPSFSRLWYRLCPPDSRRRGWLRKLK